MVADQQDIKHKLKELSKINRLIANKSQELQRWKAVATNTSARVGERVQSNSEKQKMASAVCEYAQLQVELEQAIIALVKQRQSIMIIIEQLPVVEYDILYKRYLQDMSFEDIASFYGKTYTWVTTMHGKGLKHIRTLLKAQAEGI